MKVGKAAAFAFGGGIILLQIANKQGYVKVNWDKIYRQADKAADRLGGKATGQGPEWTEKVRTILSYSACICMVYIM
jgi:uncharacterized membrane protein (Fun14 family)